MERRARDVSTSCPGGNQRRGAKRPRSLETIGIGTFGEETRRRESKLLTAGFGRCRRSAELRRLGRPAAENQGISGSDRVSCRSVLISGLGLNLRGLCPHGVHRRERRPRIGHVVVWSLSGRHPGLAKLLGFVNIAMVLAAFVLVLAVVVLVTPRVDPRRSES